MKGDRLFICLLVGLTIFVAVQFRQTDEPRQAFQQVEAHPEPRSHEWPRVRREHLEREPGCAVCGKTEDCEVHHVVPFHVKPKMELESKNLITLCRDHHLLFGHLDSWRSWNEDVRKDAADWSKKIKERP